MAKDGDVVLADPSAAALVTKKKKERRARSWIVVDSTGQGTIFDADKQSIIHRAHIHGRDLRILDPFLSYPSAILGRDRAIVLNFEHIKAIITCEEVFLRDPLDENVMPVVDELQRQLAHVQANPKAQVDENDYTYEQNDVEAGEEDECPFEFRALEVALEAICSFLAGRTTELENAAYPALDELTCKISSYNLDRVRKLKSTMARLTARVQKVRDEFERLLDDDDDLSHLCLSRKVATSSSPVSGSGDANWLSPSPTLGSKISAASRAGVAAFHEDNNDIEELEMLLEAYFVQITQTLSKLAMLREYVDDTEDYLTIQLERYRNQLIQLEIFLNAGICCISIISVVAGIFGVNIQYTWNNGYGYMLKWVLIATGLLAGSVFALIMAYARHKGLAEF